MGQKLYGKESGTLSLGTEVVPGQMLHRVAGRGEGRG